MAKSPAADGPRQKPPTAKPAPPRPRAQHRSVILSSVAVAGIVVFLAGAVLTVIGFFTPSTPTIAFSGEAPGMKLSTSDVGLALGFLGALFVGLVAVLRPAAGVLFFEEDRRPWIERMPPWFGPAFLAIAVAALAALVVALVRG